MGLEWVEVKVIQEVVLLLAIESSSLNFICQITGGMVHVGVDEAVVAAVWLALEQVRRRRLGGEGEGAEGVHDQVDPEELHLSSPNA